MSAGTCALCPTANAEAVSLHPKPAVHVECPRCGRYEITTDLQEMLRSTPDTALLTLLAAHTRQASARGELVALDRHNYEPLADGHRHTSVEQKLERVLRFFGDRSTRPGSKVQIGTDDWLLFDCEEPGEVGYFIDALIDRSLLERHPGTMHVIVTPEGWQRLAPVSPGGEPNTCFVAMSFDSSLDDAYTLGIAKAIEACGLKAIQLSKLQHNGIVDDVMLAAIRRAKLTIVDVTMQRTGVYFEAGFALGLGRTVIWTCRQDDLMNVHFDVRQYNYVVWTTPQDLREKLEARIRATVEVR